MGEILSDNETNADGESNVTDIMIDGSLLSAAFRTRSVEIITDVVNYVCGETNAPPCKSATIMRSLVDDLLRNRLTSMRQLADKLDVQRLDDIALLDNVATAMFDDDVVTWGRIVTLFAFAGYLARHSEERGMLGCSEAVVQALNTLIVERLGLWILANGGWEAFDRQFPAFCLFEPSILWKAAGFLVLLCGAALTFYTSMQFISPS